MRNRHQHPAPWWYRLAARLFPSRCREIPAATDPSRILLRQVAIVKRHVYLQGFASGESPLWWHCHQWSWLICIGLWGSYSEARPNDGCRRIRAPYLRAIGHTELHAVHLPARGHTSLVIGLWEAGERRYFRRRSRHWSKHVLRKVQRI